MIIYPDGNGSEKGSEHISVYLAISGTSSLPSGWEVNAMFTFFLFNQFCDNYLAVRGKLSEPVCSLYYLLFLQYLIVLYIVRIENLSNAEFSRTIQLQESQPQEFQLLAQLQKFQLYFAPKLMSLDLKECQSQPPPAFVFEADYFLLPEHTAFTELHISKSDLSDVETAVAPIIVDPNRTFKEASNGYLVDDKCVFGAEIFIIKKQAMIERLRALAWASKQNSIPTRSNGRKATTKQLEYSPPQILLLPKKDTHQIVSFLSHPGFVPIGSSRGDFRRGDKRDVSKFECDLSPRLPTASLGRSMKGLDTWKLLQYMYETNMYSILQ
uniref:Uncharacterized protein LOC104230272 n=1 Tax=Nicotiana sylvestris TaxID=4096 RepID=A0A1U7WRX8_NICSY|nr:PREDICTED: uncharacterized protein LOC104230272 [Nicotiana sylvestris]